MRQLFRSFNTNVGPLETSSSVSDDYDKKRTRTGSAGLWVRVGGRACVRARAHSLCSTGVRA